MFGESRGGWYWRYFSTTPLPVNKSDTGTDMCLCTDNDVMESDQEAAVYPSLFKICNPQLKRLAKILTVSSAWGVF